MYEIITQDKFRMLLGEHINKAAEQALYGVDIVYPMLEKMQFGQAQQLLSGYGGLISTLTVLSSNIDLVLKDKLTKDTDDIVYYLNEEGMPAKTTKVEYDKIIKIIQNGYEEEYESGYLQKPPDDDENMFG